MLSVVLVPSDRNDLDRCLSSIGLFQRVCYEVVIVDIGLGLGNYYDYKTRVVGGQDSYGSGMVKNINIGIEYSVYENILYLDCNCHIKESELIKMVGELEEGIVISPLHNHWMKLKGIYDFCFLTKKSDGYVPINEKLVSYYYGNLLWMLAKGIKNIGDIRYVPRAVPREKQAREGYRYGRDLKMFNLLKHQYYGSKYKHTP